MTETWCSDDVTNAFLSLDGYELIPELRMDRTDTERGRGGGLIVYAKCGIPVLKIDKKVLFLQLACFKVSDVTFNLVYRSPNAPIDSIAELSNLVKTAEKNSIFLGDFNLPGINWEVGTSRGREAAFLTAVQDACMEQLIDFPTQVKGNILDLLVTNIPERVGEVFENGRLSTSDHVIIMASVGMGEAMGEDDGDTVKNWRKADWEAMRGELSDRRWVQDLKRLGTGDAWAAFCKKIEECVNRYVPVRRKRNRNRPPWLNQEILRAIRKKKRVWKQVKGGPIPAEYKELEKTVKNMIRTSKRKFEKNLASSKTKNKKPFFAYIKKQTGCRQMVGPLKNGEGKTISDTVGMAEILNKTFQEAFTREDLSSVPEAEDMLPDSILEEIIIRERDVRQKIRNLKKESAAGPDSIGPALLKELQEELVPALTVIFRKSIQEGVVPGDWKVANVTPIFKKGSKAVASNYRPVSLTSVACKVMESIIRDAVTDHLDRHHLIRNSQHGFMKNRSCTTNLLEFLEKATTVVDEGGGYDVIYLDFSKAFDKVPITRLLKKVWAHGIRGRAHAWIRDWLTGRKQRVVLNGRFSSWEDVLSGVPQGSVLGPLLFLIFINDLDTAAAKADLIKKFADDTKLGKRVENEDDRKELQEDLDSVMEWANTWGMAFNVDKCKVMHMGRSNRRYQYTMGGKPLKVTEEEKDIGVYITSNLKPSTQCAAAARTAQAVLGQITRAFHYRDRHTFVKLYQQYVRPHLEFATQAWSPWTEGDKQILEKVQERVVKMVSGLKSNTYEGRLKELEMDTLEERRHQADMCMIRNTYHAWKRGAVPGNLVRKTHGREEPEKWSGPTELEEKARQIGGENQLLLNKSTG